MKKVTLPDGREKWVDVPEYVQSLEEQLEAARKAAAHAAYLAEHLWQMIPEQAWRDTGGDDGQGHYEGDYHAEKARDDIKKLRETYPISDPVITPAQWEWIEANIEPYSDLHKEQG
jgi:hypothetical protein